jgi:phasin family protein
MRPPAILQCTIFLDIFVRCTIFAITYGEAGHNREDDMLNNFDDVQKLGKDGIDATLKSFNAASKGAQAIVTEVADYTRKSFEQNTAALEKLLGARTLESAIEVQTEFARSAYEDFIAQATRIGELYADIAKEAYKPFEGYFTKTA